MENYTCSIQESDKDFKPIVVKKIVLVYDIEEIIEIEKQIDKLVEKKKKVIKESKYNYDSPNVKELDEEIEKFEKEIKAKEHDYQKSNKNFTGVAFVSFENELMKEKVLKDNQHTGWEQIKSFCYDGKSPMLKEHEL
jgi:hypothetical protein